MNHGLRKIELTPQMRSCLVCIALLLPGSFLVLPLVWLWRRSRTRFSAANGVRKEGAQA